jgi:hypothetical protein
MWREEVGHLSDLHRVEYTQVGGGVLLPRSRDSILSRLEKSPVRVHVSLIRRPCRTGEAGWAASRPVRYLGIGLPSGQNYGLIARAVSLIEHLGHQTVVGIQIGDLEPSGPTDCRLRCLLGRHNRLIGKRPEYHDAETVIIEDRVQLAVHERLVNWPDLGDREATGRNIFGGRRRRTPQAVAWNISETLTDPWSLQRYTGG